MNAAIEQLKVNVMRYVEPKPHRIKRMVWAIVNATIFRIVSQRKRFSLLRLFGARIRSGAIARSAKIYAPWNLENEHSMCIGPNVEVYNKDNVFIGVQAVISQDAYICTATHDITSPRMALVTKPIRIESQAWVAAKATILPGVTIGEGAVVGACAVVAKDVPPWSVVVGNPARVVGKREIKGE